MFIYTVPYNQENANKYTKIIDEMEDVEICFTKDSKKPRLLCTRVIYANWFGIHLYSSSNETIENNEEADREVDEVINADYNIMLGTCSQ